jgi:hypothetical protein
MKHDCLDGRQVGAPSRDDELESDIDPIATRI